MMNNDKAFPGAGSADWSARCVEVLARSTTVLLMSVFAATAIHQWLARPQRVTLLLLVVSETLAIALSLMSRVPRRRDWAPATFVCTVAATYYFLAVRLAPGQHLISEAAGITLQATGLAWQIFAKLSLRRSYGLLPANRGIVSGGAYRVMRHPIYAGYALAHVGFLLANFGWQNFIVYAGLFALQVYRILREEKLLGEDAAYRAYCTRVRFRVIPGVF